LGKRLWTPVFGLQCAVFTAWQPRRYDVLGQGSRKSPSGVRVREPVNKFPDLVRYLVRRLKVLFPSVGRKRIAQTLARAGLRLSTSTVGRKLKD